MVSESLHRATRPEVNQQALAPGIAAVEVSGEFDLGTVGRLEASMEDALTHGSALLVIDFTGCIFIDCSVISLLTSFRDRLAESDGPRLVVVAGDQPLHVLRLTELDREMPVFESLPGSGEVPEFAGGAGS